MDRPSGRTARFGLAVALVLAACSSPPPAPMPSLLVTPATATAPAGIKVPFAATLTTDADAGTGTAATGVTWTSSDTSVATVDADGNATGLKAGMATITATSGKLTASAQLTVTDAVLVAIDVSPKVGMVAVGLTASFAAQGTYSDGSTKDITATVMWQSSDPSVGTVDVTGTATGVAPGLVDITATAPGWPDGKMPSLDGGMPIVQGKGQLDVTAAQVRSIEVTPSLAAVPAGITQQFVAVATYSDGTMSDVSSSATWASDNMMVATVSNTAGSRGVATGVAPGTANISAAVAGVSGKAMLTVTTATLKSISIGPSHPTLAAGTTLQLKATGTFTDETTQDITSTVAWTSSDTSVVGVGDTLGNKGVVSGYAVGTATVTASQAGVQGSIDVLVTPATLVSLDVTPKNALVPVGTSLQLKVTGTFSDNSTQDLTQQATWTSAETGIAVVGNSSGKGLVTGVAQGLAQISATVGKLTAMTNVVVTTATLKSIAVTPSNPVLPKGTSLQLTATAVYSDMTTQDITSSVTWASSDQTIVSVSNANGNKGAATALAQGMASITASSGSVTGSTSVTVTIATLTSIAVTPTNPMLAKGTTQQLQATGTYSDNSTQNLTSAVTWSTGNASVATVSTAQGTQGQVTATGVGTTTIKATQGNVLGTTTVTVSVATLTALQVTPANATIAKGTTQQFKATGVYSDNTTQDLTASVTWASSNNAIATISNAQGTQGVATAAGVGSATISATVGGMTGSTTLNVSMATLTAISVTPSNATLPSGTTKQFTATGIYSDNSTQNLTSSVTWASSDTSIATISNAGGSIGVAKGVSVGMTTISASLSGTTGSTTLTVSNPTLQSIQVTPTTPSIAKGTTLQFKATGVYSDSTTADLTTQVTWATGDTTIATESNAAGSIGVATGVGAGSTAVTATLNTVKGQTTLTVTSATLQSIVVTPPAPTLARTTNVQLVATGTYSDGSQQDLTSMVTWTTKDSTVATVSNAAGSQGLVGGAGAGSTTVTAALGNVNGQASVTVTSATLSSIAVTPAGKTIAKGTTIQYAAVGTFSDGSTQDLTNQATWASSNTNIAIISTASGSQGLAQAQAAGPTTISASFGKATGSTTLTVSSATLQSIQVTAQYASIAPGTVMQYTATGNYSDGSTQNLTTQVTWLSSNTTAATISNSSGSNGLVTALAAGTANISATFGGLSGAKSLMVTGATIVSIAVTPVNGMATVPLGGTAQFVATGTFSDTSQQDITQSCAWTASTNPRDAVAGPDGLVYGVSKGSATVYATFKSKTGSTSVTVQ